MNTALHDLTETQYEDLYHVDDAPILDLRLKALSRLGWWATVLTVVGAVVGFLVVIPDTIQTPFVLKSEKNEDIYRFPSAVYVEQVFVRNGQHVKAGDTILEISAPDIAELGAELAAAQNSLTSFRQYKTVVSESERQIIELTIRRMREEIALKTTQLKIAEQKWVSESNRLQLESTEAKRVLTQNQGFYKNGDISKNDLNQFEVMAVRAQNAYELAYQNYIDSRNTLQREITSRELEISGLGKQIAKSTNDHLLEAERLSHNVAAIRQRLESTYGTFDLTVSNHLVIKAKRNGTVSFLFEGEKEVAPSAILLKMIYEEAPLYALAQVNSSQIGKVQVGQAVALKLDAYPVYEWGVVEGTVTTVSLTPDEKGQFNLRIQLTNRNKIGSLMRIGMQGQSTITADERNIYGYLFRKFRKSVSTWVD